MKEPSTVSQQQAGGMFFGLSFSDLVAILSRGFWRILTVFLIVMFVVSALTFLMKPTYETSASLLVDTQQSATALFQDPRNMGMSIDVMQNELAILGSRSLAEDVANRLLQIKYVDSTKKVLLPIVLPIEGDTVNPDIASVETIVARFAKQVTFSSERDSYVMTVTATSVNPHEAAMIANTYAEAYSDRNVFSSRTRSRSLREFLGRQLMEKRQALELKEDSLQAYMQRSGAVSLTDETKSLLDQMATLDAERDETEIEIRSALTTLVSYKQQIEQQEKNIAKSIGEASDPYIRMLQEQLAQLEVQRDIALAQNQGQSAKTVNKERIAEIDREIADLREKLQSRTQAYVENILPSGSNPLDVQKDPTGYLKDIKQKFLETQIQIQTLQTKRDALNDAMKPYERRFASVPGKSIELARLTREKAGLEQVYSLLETRYNEAKVTEQSELGYVNLFDRAPVPLVPSSPNIMLNMLLGIVLGSGMGVALVFVKELMGERIYSPEDLLRRGFVPLSTVGVLGKKWSKQKKQNGPRGLAYQITAKSPFSPVTEAFRHLRTNIQAVSNGEPLRTFMVTSPDPGEGKTTVACNLAVVLAQSGRNVLLVDADMREPAVHTAFGLDNRNGLAQIIDGKSGDDRLLQKTSVPNLTVLCSGQPGVNPGELLESADMKFLVTQLAEQFDVVIFDSPPVLAVTDSLILANLVQGVIIVVSAGTTSASMLQRAADSLTKIGVRIAGVVLNNFNVKRAYGFLSHGSGYGYYGYADRYGTKTAGKKAEKKKTPVS